MVQILGLWERIVSVYRADGFTTLLLYFANKRQVSSKGLVTSVARLFYVEIYTD